LKAANADQTLLGLRIVWWRQIILVFFPDAMKPLTWGLFGSVSCQRGCLF